MDNDAIATVFEEWNKGDLNSYLINITARILRFKDVDGNPLLDKILDVAGQKGTGKWASITAMDEDEPLTLITEAVYARMLSALYEERERASAVYPKEIVQDDSLAEVEIEKALYAAKIISYTQGFSLLHRASERYGWKLDLGTVAMIWRKGCIIRSVFLEKITDAYQKQSLLNNLLFDEFFKQKIEACIPAWRKAVSEGVISGVALPAMSAALSYFDGLTTLHSAANLLQAQRDYFGAHTYERTDRERGRFFHTDWLGVGSEVTSGVYNV